MTVTNFSDEHKGLGDKILGKQTWALDGGFRPPVHAVNPRAGVNMRSGVCLESNPVGPPGDGGQRAISPVVR
jgi:hypothetical protein